MHKGNLNQMQNLSEEETKKRFIEPALSKAGWDFENIKMELGVPNCTKDYEFSQGAIDIKSGKRNKQTIKKADYVLYYKGACLAVIEAKAYKYEDSEGLEQAKGYAKALQAPFVYASSGKGFCSYTFVGGGFDGVKREDFSLDSFPSPKELYERFKLWHQLKNDNLLQTYYDLSKITPRYYQRNAIESTLLAAQKGQMRILLVLATGTGKTQVAYQIAHRLFHQSLPNGRKIQKILYLADRNELINTDTQRTFKSFAKGIHRIENRDFSKTGASLYFGIYQQFISGSDDDKQEHYKKLSPNFFDLIFIDECHRGSAREDSAWREILEYFYQALQIGMTATPKQDDEVGDNIDYFGAPVYQYSLKQGIEDGFLAPFCVVENLSNIERDGYTPELGKIDEEGQEIPDKLFSSTNFNREIYLKPQIRFVAQQVSEFLHQKLHNPYAKTIIFCEDQRHALLMKDALQKCNENKQEIAKDSNYIARITSDDEKGRALLDDFKSITKPYPVIVTTSQLLSTGVDTQMVQVIAIDKIVRDKSLFKQMIGRGTRLNPNLESQGKTHFYVLDFKGIARDFLNDPEFDGEIEFISGDKIGEKKPKPNETKENAGTDKAPLPSVSLRTKHTIDGEEIQVSLESSSVMILREIDGVLTPITESLESFSGQKLKGSNAFASYLHTLRAGDREKREELLAMLESKGIFISELKQMEKFKNCDEFDILLSLATGQSALTRKERAKKANTFLESLKPKARELVELLLEKYAQNGFDELSPQVFTLEPFISKYNRSTIGQILQENGGFDTLIQNLKKALYEEAS